MCDDCGKTQAPGYANSGIAMQQEARADKEFREPNFRDHLEQKRNRLTKQLAQVEVALQLIYTNPDAEKIYAILNRV